MGDYIFCLVTFLRFGKMGYLLAAGVTKLNTHVTLMTYLCVNIVVTCARPAWHNVAGGSERARGWENVTKRSHQRWSSRLRESYGLRETTVF